MNRHLFASRRKNGPTARAAAHHSAGLAAWLRSDAEPDESPNRENLKGTADWSAPGAGVLLTYDTAEQGLPSGVRAVVQEGSRRIMFESNEYEIVVQVAVDRRTQRQELTGQILFEGLPLPGAAVRWDRGESPTTTSTDYCGGFRLPPLARGAYALQIAVPGAVLRTPPIALG